MTLTHEFRRTGQTTRTLPASGTRVDGFRDSHDINGGFTAATGNISEAEYTSHTALYQMGTTWLVKDDVTAEYIWAGQLNDPEVLDDGSVILTADGWGKLSDTSSGYFLLLSYNLESWVMGDQEPLSYNLSDKYNVKIGGNTIAWVIDKETAFKRNDLGNPAEWWSGAFRYTPGNDIRYISFSIEKPKNMPDYKLQIVKGTGPSGALTVVQQWTLDAGAPSSVTQAITAGSDMVGIRVLRTTQAEQAEVRRVAVKNVHIGSYIQSDTIELDDAFSLLFDEMNITTKDISASTVSAVPYEADQGTFGQIADELSLLDNWNWRIDVNGAGSKVGYAGPIGRKTWNLVRANSPVHLLPQPRYSHVRFSYKAAGGVTLTDTVQSSPAIVPAGYERTFQLDLPEPPHFTVAQLFAQKVANYMSEIRHSGTASFTFVTDPSGPTEVHGTKVRPGDKLVLTNQDNRAVIVNSLEHDAGGDITTVSLANGQPMLDQWLARNKRLLNKGFSADRAAFALLSVDTPSTPTNVQVDYRIKEVSDRLHYRGIVTWDAVTQDVAGEGTAIKRYDVQMRPVNASGQWLHEDGSVVTGSQQGYRLRHVVNTGLDGDPATKSTFDELQHPKTWRWQARVKATDVAAQESAWSAWTTASLPFTDAEPSPPAPTGVVLTFDTTEKDRHTRISAKTTFNEVTNFSYPGDAQENEDHVAHYDVQLQRSNDGGTTPGDIRKRTMGAADADADTNTYYRWDRVRKRYSYRTRVRCRDKWGRPGTWSSWTAWATPDDNTAPPVPTGLVAKGQLDEVNANWDDSDDTADTELMSIDVAYYQVRLTKGPLATSPLVKVWKMRVESAARYKTDEYKVRHWFHVRAVDSSGNKSAWNTAGPVRPSKVAATRDVATGMFTGVDWSLRTPDEELVSPAAMIAGGGDNSAYATTSSGLASAIAEGEDDDGTAELVFTTGMNTGQNVVGIVLRASDPDNFIGVVYNDVDYTLRIVNQSGSTQTSLASYGVPVDDLSGDRTYNLKVIASGTSIQVYLDSILRLTHSTGTYLGNTKHGFYVRRGSGWDTGVSRLDRYRFTNAAGQVVIDDEFDRQTSSPTPAVPGWSSVTGELVLGDWVLADDNDGVPAGGGSGIGAASSGQPYSVSGAWAIEQTQTGFAIFGSSVELPMYFCEMMDTHYNFIKSWTDSSPPNPSVWGCDGKDTPGLIIEIDRPTRFIVHGECNVQNDGPNDANIRFYVMARQYQASSWQWSRQKNIWSQAYDAGNVNNDPVPDPQEDKQRGGSTLGMFYFEATPESPLVIELAWGFTIMDSVARPCAVRNCTMAVTAAYSPSYSPSFSTTRRSRWTKSAMTRASYRVPVSSPNIGQR